MRERLLSLKLCVRGSVKMQRCIPSRFSCLFAVVPGPVPNRNFCSSAILKKNVPISWVKEKKSKYIYKNTPWTIELKVYLMKDYLTNRYYIYQILKKVSDKSLIHQSFCIIQSLCVQVCRWAYHCAFMFGPRKLQVTGKELHCQSRKKWLSEMNYIVKCSSRVAWNVTTFVLKLIRN